ncbi:MAG: threonine/serine dehydratase [Pseudomonadota bacterium]
MDWTAEITAARARIAGHTRVTPVARLNLAGFDLEVKLEQLQHTGSFKTRGAFNTLLSQTVPKAGVVAASGGNHGAAVGFAAAALGHDAHIYVPELAGPAKIALIERTGATCHVVPGLYADAFTAAEAYQTQTGAMQIHAYDAQGTVAGQGTCFAEWDDQGLRADTVLIAVGGGGLISGALGWFGQSRKVVAVEPETCATLHTALIEGAPQNVPISGVAANALGARRIGQICFGLAQGAPSVTVTDAAILEAQHLLWREARLLVEPGGACALAALMSGAYVPATGEKIAVLVCGANISPDPFP